MRIEDDLQRLPPTLQLLSRGLFSHETLGPIPAFHTRHVTRGQECVWAYAGGQGGEPVREAHDLADTYEALKLFAPLPGRGILKPLLAKTRCVL